MLYNSCLIALVLFALNCSHPNENTPAEIGKSEIPKDVNYKLLFTQQHAEKILGEAVMLKDSSTQITKSVSTFSCSYSALAMDTVSGKTGVVYVMFQQFSKASDAEKTYTSIKKDNEGHEGVETIKDLGDEAYFHSDHQNFYFILVRKAGKVFRMKVNKITSHTSQSDFNSVAREITAAM